MSNASKCQFCVVQIHCLGYVVSSNVIKLDPDQLSAVMNSSSPTDFMLV